MTNEQEQNQVETPVAPPAKVELAWTTFPVKRNPTKSALVSAFLLVVTYVVYAITSSAFFAALALIALFASVAKFYLPTFFTLTEREIIIKSTTQTIKKEWKQFRSYYPDKNGVLISPFVEPSRLENFRGMYLIFEGNRDEVLAVIANHIQSDQQKEIG